MLYPSISTLLEKIDSRYLLVNVIARRAREIADEADEREEILEKKPVSMAIAEIANDDIYIQLNNDSEQEE